MRLPPAPLDVAWPLPRARVPCGPSRVASPLVHDAHGARDGGTGVTNSRGSSEGTRSAATVARFAVASGECALARGGGGALAHGSHGGGGTGDTNSPQVTSIPSPRLSTKYPSTSSTGYLGGDQTVTSIPSSRLSTQNVPQVPRVPGTSAGPDRHEYSFVPPQHPNVPQVPRVPKYLEYRVPRAGPSVRADTCSISFCTTTYSISKRFRN